MMINRAPVHITTGSAGCREKHDGFLPNPPQWSAVRYDQENANDLDYINVMMIMLMI